MRCTEVTVIAESHGAWVQCLDDIVRSVPCCLQGNMALANIVWTTQNDHTDLGIIDQCFQSAHLLFPADQLNVDSNEFLVQMSPMASSKFEQQLSKVCRPQMGVIIKERD